MSLFRLTGFGLLCALLVRLCPQRHRWLVLLFASLGFYFVKSRAALPVLLLTALILWAFALLFQRIEEKGKEARKGLTGAQKKQVRAKYQHLKILLLLPSLVLSLLPLCIFKYTNEVRAWMGLSPLGLLFPLGISFYTFQGLSYLLDVYHGKVTPARNPLRLLLFLSYFPQLIQGPIGRWDALSPQLQSPPDVDLEGLSRGSLLLLWGLMKKLILADRAAPAVALAFDGPLSGSTALLGVFLYSLQQYCDFSGGIDLVAGLAECMGIRLAENFRRPYFSVSLGDFWRRWHISLGAFMRDYVFYPFALCAPVARLCKHAQDRFGKTFARTLPAVLGNLLVFTLVGLWHGASAHFLVWGLYNGLVLALSSLLEPQIKAFNEAHPFTSTPGFHLFRVLRTFLIVNIGWFFDRSTTLERALAMLRAATLHPGIPGFDALGLAMPDVAVLLLGTIFLFLVSLAAERGRDLRGFVLSRPLPLRFLLILSAILSVVILGVWGSGFNEASFIYNQI